MKRKFLINGKEVSISDINTTDGKVSFSMDGENYIFELVAGENGYGALIEENAHFRLFIGQQEAHERRHVFLDGKEAFVAPVPRGRKRQEAEKTSFIAPMPGKIVEVHVKPKDKVKQGQAVITMEAMKLQHTLYAPQDGVVEEVHYAVGAQVHDGALLVKFKEEA
jgi:3-methylcrotonyl-CoA carboxylase alpha subunit